jgi:hypothetical protein
MKSITIIFGEENEVDKYDEEKNCPVAIVDEEANAEGRARAVKEAKYGEAMTSKACENCGAYNQTENIMECIEEEFDQEEGLGYCQIFKFVCSSDNTCNRWVRGGPITDEKMSVGSKESM